MPETDAHGQQPSIAAAEPGDPTESKENDLKPATDEVVDESDAKLPAPLTNGAYRKILKELPDGPRIAAETCVQFWKVRGDFLMK
jgi:hypothetical protein